MEINQHTRMQRNESLQSSANMSAFKIKCPANGWVFINFTRLDAGASIKIYLKTRPLRSDQIVNENHSMSMDGMHQGRGDRTLNYKCSTANESLVFMSIVSNGAKNTSTERTEFSFELVTVQCLYWQTTSNAWQSDGCLVDAELSTFDRVHCKCNHLSLFAVKHHKSDFCAIFPDNTPIAPMKSVIWICFLFLLLLCSIMVFWAWRRDKLDASNHKLIYLKDDHFRRPYHYAVTVVTGSRRNATTTAHVAIRIHGDQCTTPQIIPLFDRRVQLFQRGSRNTFIIQTKRYVGRIEKITLCHDCHGLYPSWYCDAVIICDVQRNEEWTFDVNRWFSAESGDKTFTASFDIIAEKEYYKRKRMLRLHWTKLLHNSYSLFSICLRSSASCRKLSRVEKVCVAFAAVLMGLMANVLFFCYNRDDVIGNSMRNILTSAVIGCCTTFMVRMFLIFLLMKSKSVKSNNNRHWKLMFLSESI